MSLKRGIVTSFWFCGSIFLSSSLASYAFAQTEDAKPPMTESAGQKDQMNSDKGSEIAQGKKRGLLGPVRIGPYVSLNVPHPLTYGIDGIYEDIFSFGFSTSSFNTESNTVKLELDHWDIRARWHVFQGSFFLGAAYGQQTLKGSSRDNVATNVNGSTVSVPTTVEIEVKTNYLTPHIGWLWIWDSGFHMGFELGVQLPSGNKTSFDTNFENVSAAEQSATKNSQEYKDLEKDVKDAGDLIGKATLPHLTMLRFGWFF
ncbi:MAG: hypothetical protein ACOH5I_15450 [Oligoflexus sp.]